jgi:hypothetical protein
MGEHTRIEGGAVVCRYCNAVLTFNFIDRPAGPHSCEGKRAAEAKAMEDADRLYLKLHGAREALCVAQMLVPPHWRSDLQAAFDHIDECGSAVCPEVWSKHDQPEYGETKNGSNQGGKS